MGDWFADWFDSKYYHILYKNRNDAEAQLFIDNIISYLQLTDQDKVLDLACGKGRHSIYLNQKGLDVMGVDLSPESIQHAQQFANDTLSFQVKDMREVVQENHFSVVLNLFTSFGYFDDDREQLKTIKSIRETLQPNGRLVLDFMNVEKVIAKLVTEEQKEVDGVTFHIQREVKDGFIQKHIAFDDEGQSYRFTEKVKVIYQSDFERYLTNWELIDTFGNYQLEQFDAQTSDRLILVAKKKN